MCLPFNSVNITFLTIGKRIAGTPRVTKSGMGGGAFTSNSPPVEPTSVTVWEADKLSSLKSRLKTFLWIRPIITDGLSGLRSVFVGQIMVDNTLLLSSSSVPLNIHVPWLGYFCWFSCTAVNCYCGPTWHTQSLLGQVILWVHGLHYPPLEFTYSWTHIFMHTNSIILYVSSTMAMSGHCFVIVFCPCDMNYRFDHNWKRDPSSVVSYFYLLTFF